MLRGIHRYIWQRIEGTSISFNSYFAQGRPETQRSVQTLYEIGSDPDRRKDMDGQTPFMLAEISGRVDIANSLR